MCIIDHSCTMSNFLCVQCVRWKLILYRTDPLLNDYIYYVHASTQNSIRLPPPYATNIHDSSYLFCNKCLTIYNGDRALEGVGNFVPPHEGNTHICRKGVNCVWGTWDLRTAKRAKMLVDQKSLFQSRHAHMRKYTRLVLSSL